MCGICGFFKFRSSNTIITEEQLKRMNDKMILRGPDGYGIWIEEHNICGLGHRRLSVIDLSNSAAQPMSNVDNTIILTYNGEIYNHVAIKDELKGKYIWKTDHSDTEVLLHAYEEWGMNCLNKFRGMFAFALWDARKRELVLCRDRIGIKPLYYAIEDNVLYFASEIKAILPALKKKPRINYKALYDYLSFLTTPTEETLFEGIYKLRPSTYIIFDQEGRCKKIKYWDVWEHTNPDLYYAKDEEIRAVLLSELRNAVSMRKQADVPVGVFLSGGIDSSTNAALFSEGKKQKIKTFCIGYDKNYKSYTNETYYAKKMADYCGAEYYEKLLNLDDLFSFLPEMVRLQDEPIADPVCIPVFYVSKLARENGVIVSQVGEGSDELFWGYKSWKTYLQLASLNDIPIPKEIKKKGLLLLQLMRKNRGLPYELLRRACMSQPIFWGGAIAFYDYDKKNMISDILRKELNGYDSFEAIRPTYNNFLDKAWEKSHLNWMSYCDLCHRLPELLLMRVDKMSMGVSLECRVPFLDHKFVELAMSISQAKKTEGKINKVVLKRTVRGLIPDEIIDRKKQGFGVPLYDWFLGRLGKEMEKTIVYFSKETGLFNTKYIKEMFNNKGYANKLWYLYNLSLWWEAYIK